MLIRIKGAISNCYLLLGEKPVLVDTGAPGDLRTILAALQRHKVAPKDLALILLTHGHSDHAGCAAELKRRSGAQVAIHAGDAALARTGRNGVIAVQDTLGRILRPKQDGGPASFYSLVSADTREQEFGKKRQLFLLQLKANLVVPRIQYVCTCVKWERLNF